MIRHLIVFNLLFVMGFVACVTAPESGRKQLMLVPESQMEAMGDQAYAELKQKEKISHSAPLTAIIGRIGKDIAVASGKEFDWQFTLFDAPDTVNAFCLPGGKVGVYTGILPVAENEAGLAAVIGHEVAHAILHHGAERVSQTLVVQMGVSVAALSFENEDYRRLIAGALGIGMQFGVLLPFSRKQELEADMVGLKYMAKAGYDPNEAAMFWNRMAKQAGSRPPEFMSTHPDPANRAKTLEIEVRKVASLYAESDKKVSRRIDL